MTSTTLKFARLLSGALAPAAGALVVVGVKSELAALGARHPAVAREVLPSSSATVAAVAEGLVDAASIFSGGGALVTGASPAAAAPSAATGSAPPVSAAPTRRLTFVSIPSERSRHGAPIRADAVTEAVARHVPKGDGDTRVVVLLEDVAQALAAGAAVARAFPSFTRKTGNKVSRRAVTVSFSVAAREGSDTTRDGAAAGGTAGSGDDLPDELLERLDATAGGIRLAQRLVDAPPNELHVGSYVTEALAAVEGLPGVQAEVIGSDDLAARGYGGLAGVGRASEHGPALVVLTLNGHLAAPSGESPSAGASPLSFLGGESTAGPRVDGEPEEGGEASASAASEQAATAGTAAPTPSLCLVGKGITYDTGGLNIKTVMMAGMKVDMGGSAAVLGAFQALARLRYPGRLHALLCIAENSVDERSQRPDDVITTYSGKTVEINNTDAEGRLVLADGVAHASKHLQPSVLVDCATLTGAQGVITGRHHCGVLSNSDALERLVLASGRASGDLAFPFLYSPEHLGIASNFSSVVADMKNSVKDRTNAPSSGAGHFIEEHLCGPGWKQEGYDEPERQFAHLDIAYPASRDGRGTGFGVALLVDLAFALDGKRAA